MLRHSCAHVLAQAVQDTFEDAKLGIGPPIKDGFYYDFDVETPFTPEDLKQLEKRMQQIIKSGQRFSRRVVTEGDARAELAEAQALKPTDPAGIEQRDKALARARAKVEMTRA